MKSFCLNPLRYNRPLFTETLVAPTLTSFMSPASPGTVSLADAAPDGGVASLGAALQEA